MQEDNNKNTMHNEDQNHDIGRKIEESFHPEYAAAAENTDAQQAQAENATAPGADEADGIPVIDDYQYGATTDGPYSLSLIHISNPLRQISCSQETAALRR